jgi:hypothetical protein
LYLLFESLFARLFTKDSVKNLHTLSYIFFYDHGRIVAAKTKRVV